MEWGAKDHAVLAAPRGGWLGSASGRMGRQLLMALDGQMKEGRIR